MNARKGQGHEGRTDLFLYDPEALVLVEDPKHPLYDPRVKLPVDESLVRNIMVHGVLEPVGVRRDGDAVEVVFGRQRVKAAREASRRLLAEGKQKVLVPGRVQRGDDPHMFGLLLSENEIRQDDNVVAKARKLQRYLEMGRSEADACTMFGVSITTVKNWLALLDLDPEVLRQVERGTVPMTTALGLAKLPRAEQPGRLQEMLAEEGGGVRGSGARERAAKGGKGPARVRTMRKKAEVEDFKAFCEGNAKACALPADTILGWVLGVDDGLPGPVRKAWEKFQASGAEAEGEE
jgi:ParB family chromosome partitioning protein